MMYLLILLFLCMTVAALCHGMHNRKKEIRLLREEIARRDRLFIDEGNHATTWIGAKTPNAQLDL